jgi:FkbM family methyltransferase
MLKNILRWALSSIGLLNVAKRVKKASFERAFFAKYGKIEKYRLPLENIEVWYSTKDEYSKRWFFPRYDNGRIHEPSTTDIFIKTIRPDDVVLDVGTNLGYYTCLAAKLASNGKVHAFEIDNNCIPLLKSNIELNKFTNVVLNNFAVSDNNNVEKIPESSTPNPTLKITQNIARFREVKAVTLDAYVESNHIQPDFIKIDVEGAELKVLHGMSKILGSPKLTMLVEVHVNNLAKFFNSDYKDVIKLLLKNGFSVHEILDHRKGGSAVRPLSENSDLNGNTMLIAEKGVFVN